MPCLGFGLPEQITLGPSPGFMAEEGNCELPEPIIQVIQSFLTGKEAARTITLSKSWHKAWLTRPNLDFDDSDFFQNGEYFWESAKKSIQRYEDSNLKIESFRLFLQSADNYVLANLLIVKALKLGGSHLRFEIELHDCFGIFLLPREVFESENLVGLSVKGPGIDFGVDHNVRCSKLESFCLSSVSIKSDTVIPNIISSCPLIRNLSLSIDTKTTGWAPRVQINLPKLQNLKCLALSGFKLDTLFFRDLSSNFPSLKEISLGKLSVEESSTKDLGMDPRIESLSLNKVYAHSCTVFEIISSYPLIQNLSLSNVHRKKGYGKNPFDLPKLHNLKCLTLSWVKLKSLFFPDKLPALKHLTLDGIFQNGDPEQEEEEMRISSRSLEGLDLLGPCERVMFKLDVPSIQKFVIEADRSIPSVSFESTSEEEWESHVSITFDKRNPFHSTWFLKLNELLTALSPSKTHLSVNGSCNRCFDYKVRDIQGLRPQHRVENLNVDIPVLPSLNCYALFDGLFRISRPQLITQFQYEQSNTNDFLSERLEQGINGEFSYPGNFMYGVHGLEEVHVQVVGVGDVSDLPRKSNTVAFVNSHKPKQKIIFQLVWKPLPDLKSY